MQHLLLQLVEQLVELAPRLRVHEVVVAELLHTPARIRRERVELTEAAVGHPAEQFLHLRGHFALAALWRALHRRLCAGLPGLVAIRGQLVEPALDAGALGVDDVVEPLLDIVHHRGEVVAVQAALPLLLEAVHQLAHPHHPAPVRELRPALHQTPHRRAKAVSIQYLVRQTIDELLRGELLLLAAVPTRVAVQRHSASKPATAGCGKGTLIAASRQCRRQRAGTIRALQLARRAGQ